jgi:transcriptional regulator with XRE-family HTH domain
VLKSTIAKHRDHGGRSPLARGIGRELRRRRVAAGLTQTDVGRPMTRGYVSAVELGRTVPSIPALALLLGRLGVPLDDFFEGVQQEMTVSYNPPHGHAPRQDASSRHRR